MAKSQVAFPRSNTRTDARECDHDLVGLPTRQRQCLTCADAPVLPMSSTGPSSVLDRKETVMNGYVARKGERYYAVIYETGGQPWSST